MASDPSLNSIIQRQQRLLISPRKLRQKKLAHAIVDAMSSGRTLADIGRELYPNAENPSQTVSNCLKQPTAMTEINRLTADLYDETELKRTVTEILRSGKEPNRLKAAEIGMREKKMLDRFEPTNSFTAIQVNVNTSKPSEIMDWLQSKLKQSGSGLIDASSSSKDSPPSDDLMTDSPLPK